MFITYVRASSNLTTGAWSSDLPADGSFEYSSCCLNGEKRDSSALMRRQRECHLPRRRRRWSASNDSSSQVAGRMVDVYLENEVDDDSRSRTGQIRALVHYRRWWAGFIRRSGDTTELVELLISWRVYSFAAYMYCDLFKVVLKAKNAAILVFVRT